jgi:phosphoribosylformylglycinamidine synthase
MLLSRFESEGEQVVVGPGDDAAVVALPTAEDAEDVYITMGIESHNHPSYVDPFDGAATGVGGIVRDTLSMGAYPIALTDSLYFGEFEREHSRYLFEGVVEGISHYGNCIGVPTVGGSVAFHGDYEGNPLVNVSCVGLVTDTDRLVTAEAQAVGNRLVLVGNATGRDGLGGASFASEDLAEDAETEDRPAVQVGDPYAEKLLIEASEELVDRRLVESARDLGAAGLGGASSEMIAKGGKGARIELDRVHQREPNMVALEILLAESQERMCYEVKPENVDAVREVAEKYDLGFSDIGEITEGNYVCTFEGETVVDVPAEYLADGAPPNDLDTRPQPEPETDLPDTDLREAFEAVVGAPNTASKRWVYRQYDHEVGLRTANRPGDGAAVMAIREAVGADGEGLGLAISAGADPNWTTANPYEGARACAVENATNLAAKGATPLAAVDCLNGGNPEKTDVYGGFSDIVSGLADACAALSVPVVGGNVSLYNDSVTGPIPPTPTLAMVGTRSGFDAPAGEFTGEGDLLVVGDETLTGDAAPLGGSEYLAQFGGEDAFPAPAANVPEFVTTLASVADHDSVGAVHDVSHGGLAVTLAEMVTAEAGATVELVSEHPRHALFNETVGRVVVETTDTAAVREAFEGVAPVAHVGSTDDSGTLTLSVGPGGERLTASHEDVVALRSTLDREMD